MTTPPVRVVSSSNSLTYTAEVQAPVEELFAMLVNPHRHFEVDGSHSVLPKVSGPEHLAAGDEFTTDMHLFGLDYRIRNRATAVAENELVEWQHPAGHRWRWEFAALSPERTQVTETWSFKPSPLRTAFYRAIGAVSRNDDGIRATLAGLQERYSA